MGIHHDVVTISTTIAATSLADLPGLHRLQQLSLMHGWFPLVAQVITAVVAMTAVGWRSRRWRLGWLPIAVGSGIALTAATYGYVSSEGLTDDPAPVLLWFWTTLSGMALVVLVAGWRGARWWRRMVSVLAVPLSVACAALALNLWVGYFPTVQTAWNQLTAGPLPDQTDQATVVAMQHSRKIPARGSVVPVNIGSAASGFKHRGELVYLPPAWFAADPAPALPTIMMIGGEFNTPADWLRAGNAVKTMDDFATAHAGNAPVLVFVDPGGAFNNDTECVNGSRGNAADHLTKDVVPFMEHTYGVRADPASWGVVGWSMGGTCAVDLAVMHPDIVSAFEDIAGDIAPNSGTRAQTVERLFGGSAAQYAAFDPTTVMTRHGVYANTAGLFAVNDAARSTTTRTSTSTTTVVDVNNAKGPRGHDAVSHTSDQAAAAASLCGLGGTLGIDCAIVEQPGKHDWPFAARAFAEALPWLAGQIGTPDVPRQPLPVSRQ